ncbi:MAG: hypothetical protein ACRCSN_10360 [Dermatophilaceae bacterium]
MYVLSRMLPLEQRGHPGAVGTHGPPGADHDRHDGIEDHAHPATVLRCFCAVQP